MCGQIVEAGKAAEDALCAARKAKDWGQQMRAQGRRGAVFYFKDDMEGCRSAFDEAQRLQAEGEPTRPAVHADHGIFYRFYKFEIADSENEYKKLLIDAQSAEPLDANWLIPKGFDTMFKAVAKWKLGEINDARLLFEEAKNTLKESAAIAYLGWYFLTEADFQLSQHQIERANKSIEEAQRIAERYKMPLVEVDCNLIHAKAFLEQKQTQLARQAIESAEKGIEAYGYNLRILELTMLKGELASLDGKRSDAEALFKDARNLIRSTGRKSHESYLERCERNLNNF